ncbi:MULTISPECIES: hypothetical protein [Streptomyces]|uniref:Transposase n=1 Tax=Streptomyces nymphaeiformis TaxID=2663842 RepID=A0A7W7U9Y4_9ACTN|nr:hypothetical protein [Streptomyces nymphaeiformis]MBB4987568.1 transposase [Streptomyces nymphaeiformis]
MRKPWKGVDTWTGLPQAKRPGEEAEVDFADFWLDLAGQRRKCVLFTLRLSYSGKAVHRVYATASQEAFLEGHVEAFTVLGGVPSVHIRYDNLKPAVKQVLFGRSRLESARWASFKSWYVHVSVGSRCFPTASATSMAV